jgi:biopolymer transport protein TolR
MDPLPFLGFVLVLLFAFMTAEPLITKAVSIDLPTALHAITAPGATKWDAIHIWVTRDGTIYFRKQKVLAEELPNRIHDAVLNGAEKRIYLSVDARARYSDVEVVLPQVQLAGVEKVCLLTQQRSYL